MWFPKPKQDRNAHEREKESRKRPAKQEMSPQEKAKRAYELWGLAEEYEEEDE